jgi:hypothetical protein
MLHTNCFPDLTADICPRDRYDPIDDQHIRKMAKMRPCKPLASNWTPPARSPSLLPQCPLQCKLPILRLLQAWPSLPSLLASRTPRPSNSTTGEPITCTSPAIPVSTFLYNLSSAVLQHPGLDLNSWDQSIRAFSSATHIRWQGGQPGWHLKSTDVRASYQAVPSLLISACQALPTALRQRVFAPLTHWS